MSMCTTSMYGLDSECLPLKVFRSLLLVEINAPRTISTGFIILFSLEVIDPKIHLGIVFALC